MNEERRQAHDEQFKDFFGHPVMVSSFLRAFVPLPFVRALKEESLKPLPTESVDVDHHRLYGDQVWQGELSGGRRPRRCYVVILLEFQSRAEYWMPLRMLSYVTATLRFWRREREEAHRQKNERRRQEGRPLLPMPHEDCPLIFPLVVYTGRGKWRFSLEMRRLFGPVARRHLRYLPSLEFFLFDARRTASSRSCAGPSPRGSPRASGSTGYAATGANCWPTTDLWREAKCTWMDFVSGGRRMGSAASSKVAPRGWPRAS